MTSPWRNKGQWSEPSEASACRSVLGNKSSQFAEASMWSIFVIVGICWSLHQLNFVPLRVRGASSMLSIVALNLLIIGIFIRVLFLSWALRIKSKSPSSNHVGRTCYRMSVISWRKRILSTLDCGPYTPVIDHSSLLANILICVDTVLVVKYDWLILKTRSEAATRIPPHTLMEGNHTALFVMLDQPSLLRDYDSRMQF